MTDAALSSAQRLWPPDADMLATLFTRQQLAQGRRLQQRIVELHAHAQGANASLVAPGEAPVELALQGVLDADGRPHYSALCSCRARRFCEHAAAILLRLQAEADMPRREQALQQWVQALQRRAPRSELQRLPVLDPRDAARLMDLLQGEHADAAAPAEALPAPAPDAAASAQARAEAAPFFARLRLATLGRGDGLLGMRPSGKLGPRGDAVSVAQVDWCYRLADGRLWSTPAPRSLLNSRPPARQLVDGQHLLARDLAAEAEACDQLWSSALLPLDASTLQWRDDALAPSQPDYWTLVQEEGFDAFWLEQVPRLRASGWEVQALPGFAHRPLAGQAWHADLRPAPRREGSWLLSLGVEVEGELLDLAPMLAELLRRDARWLRAQGLQEIADAERVVLRAPGGRRIEAPAATLKAVIGAMVDLLDAECAGPLTLHEWDAHRLEVLGASSGWQLQGDAALRQIARRLAKAGAPPAIEPPAGLGVELRPYQRQGLAWLQYLRGLGLGGILADDMGLGKTAQTLAHLLLEQQAGRLQGRPALAVLPTSLLFNWAAEARRIAPALRVLLLHGPRRQQHFSRIADYDLVLTSYPLLWRDVETLAAQPWQLLILDEAQTVKNAASRAARAVRRLQANQRLCLTGTPVENHLGELWAQFDFLMPGLLGDARSFAQRWRKPIEDSGSQLHAQALARRVQPFLLRRRKAEVEAQLPPLTVVTRRVALLGRQRELYESVRVAADTQVRRVLASHGLARAQISVLDALLKLRQVCCDPLLLEGVRPQAGMERAKLELLAEMLPALLAEGRRVLLFSQFTRLLELVAAQLDAQGLPHLSLTGADSTAQRQATVARFQALEVPLLLISLKAGGVGLNLTAADTVIQLDPWWNPAVMAQANARAHRIGQARPVFVYQLVAAGSIEERMLDLQARKEALAEAVVGSTGGSAAMLRPEELDLLLAPMDAPG